MSYARTAVTRMTLDMSRLDLQRSETVTLGDTNRRWEITLINGGAPFRLPPNWTAALTGIKPDGNGLLNGCSVVDGKIIYDFAAGKEIATCVGSYPVHFDIWDEVGELVASPKVYVNVLADARPHAELDSKGQYTLISDAIKKITDMETDVDILADTALAQGDDIAALKEKITTAGKVTIPATEWTDMTPTYAYVSIQGGEALTKGGLLVVTPADKATKDECERAGVRIDIDLVTDQEPPSFDQIVFVRADEVPLIPLNFKYFSLKTDSQQGAVVALIGVDAYGDGGGSVDETAVRAIITAVLGNVANERQYSAANPPPYPVTSVNGKTGAVSLSIPSKASDVGADPAGTASSKLITHNVDTASHQDLRLELQRVVDRINAALNSDDTSLDDLKEIVAYIKANKTLIDSITSSKVNVTDIVDNLITNSPRYPLSAAQGVALKLLIDSLEDVVEGKVTAEQVAEQLQPFITKTQADQLYQPIGSAAEEPAPDDLPSLFFGADFPATKAETPPKTTVRYISRTATWDAYVTTKVQGSGTTTFLKDNMTINLFADETYDNENPYTVSFRGWPSASKFVLKAYVADGTLSRDPVTCQIWGDLVKSRPDYGGLPAALRNSPNQGAIDGFLVQVYVKGVYYGLYALTIPKDGWMTGMTDYEEGEANYDKQAIICGEGSGESLQYLLFRRSYPDLSAVVTGYDWDDELESIGNNIRQSLMDVNHLIVNGSDEELKAALPAYLDIQSAIDAYLLIYYGCGVDTIGKNQTWITYNGGKPWYMSIYDGDAYWGGDPAGAKIYPFDTPFQEGYIASLGANRLYERLWECYQDQIRARWNEVKHTVLSPANVITRFQRYLRPVTTELLAENHAPTTANGKFTTTIDPSNKGFDSVPALKESTYIQIRNFAAARWAYVDEQINYIACTGITLDKTTLALTADNDTVALVVTVTPSDCNDTVVWSTDDESVATVTGGYVKGIYNGSCNITATCGAYSATCVVTVSGFITPAADNLADPNGSDWLAGYNAGSSGNMSDVNSNEIALSNKIAFRLGDVFVIKGAQIRYGHIGYAHHVIYNANEQAVGSLFTSDEKSTITVSGRVSTITLTEGWMNNFITADKMPSIKERGGYIRFQLKIFEGQKELATDKIDIRRFPDKASADAWIAANP